MPKGTDLEQLRAYESIRQLAARYAVAIDSRDLEALVALYVPDVQVGPGASGRDALRASFDTKLRAIGASILNVGTHVINLIDADHATGVVYCKGEIADAGRWIHQAIVYDDEYRRVDGTWYFERRVHQLFYGAEVGLNPLDMPPANWPEHHDGWGTLPEAWVTWQRFWSPGGPEGRGTGV